MTILSIRQTCFACPSQWEGLFADNRPFYIKYRWGYLSICVGKKNKSISSATEGREIYSEQKDKEGWDGIIEEDEILKIIKNIPEESKVQIILRGIYFRFRILRIVKLFWYYCLGGKRKISKQVEKEFKKYNKQIKKLYEK